MNGDSAVRKGVAFAVRGGILEDADVDKLMEERSRLRHKMAPFMHLTRIVSVRLARIS